MDRRNRHTATALVCLLISVHMAPFQRENAKMTEKRDNTAVSKGCIKSGKREVESKVLQYFHHIMYVL